MLLGIQEIKIGPHFIQPTYPTFHTANIHIVHLLPPHHSDNSLQFTPLAVDHKPEEALTMATAMLKRTTMVKSMANRMRSYASLAVGTDLVSAAPNASLQKARSWDEGVSSKFSTTPLKDIFKVSPPFNGILYYYLYCEYHFFYLGFLILFVNFGFQGKNVVIFGLPVRYLMRFLIDLLLLVSCNCHL